LVLLFFNEVVYDECCEKIWYALMRTSWSCRYVWFINKTYLCKMRRDEMRWNPLGSHDQGNQYRNGFVHQTIALVEKAVLAEKSAR
jgi:hypothetical protein